MTHRETHTSTNAVHAAKNAQTVDSAKVLYSFKKPILVEMNLKF